MVVPIRDHYTPVGEKCYAHWLVEPAVIVVIPAERSERRAITDVENGEAILARLRNHEYRVVEGYGARSPLEPHDQSFGATRFRDHIGIEHVTE